MLEIDKIYLGDCLELMQDIPDKSIDCIICDLPYGTTSCQWDIIIPFDLLWKQYYRVLKPNGVVVLFATEPFTSKLVCSNINDFKEKLTWEKHKPTNFGNARFRHLKYTEDIVVFSRVGRYTFNPQMTERTSTRVKEAQKGNSKNWHTIRKETNEVSFGTQYEPRDWGIYDADKKLQGNLITIPSVVSNSHEKEDHPTQKPVKMLRYLIRTYSNEGDLILDNCIGSGTTAVAAIKEKRHFIGMELNKEYYDIACKRIKKEQIEIKSSLFNNEYENKKI